MFLKQYRNEENDPHKPSRYAETAHVGPTLTIAVFKANALDQTRR